jgi:hypothetical protein
MPNRPKLDPEAELLGWGLIVIFALGVVLMFYNAVVALYA